jgi:hypothetical protein
VSSKKRTFNPFNKTVMDNPRITKDTLGHSTLHFYEGELPATDPFLLWLDKEIADNISSNDDSSANDLYYTGCFSALARVKEKYLSLKQQ